MYVHFQFGGQTVKKEKLTKSWKFVKRNENFGILQKEMIRKKGLSFFKGGGTSIRRGETQYKEDLYLMHGQLRYMQSLFYY